VGLIASPIKRPVPTLSFGISNFKQTNHRQHSELIGSIVKSAQAYASSPLNSLYNLASILGSNQFWQLSPLLLKLLNHYSRLSYCQEL
jgi:hypothetical protein